MNDQTLYCSGGPDDGFHFLSLPAQNLNKDLFYCSGGNNDGFHFLTSAVQPLNYQTLFCLGGNNDGFHFLAVSPYSMNDQTLYCSGGPDDGFHSLSLPAFQFGRGIWRGVTNYSWTEPSNWTGNSVPDVTTDVVIPPMCSFYPSITTGILTIADNGGDYKCNSLTINNGGSLNNDRYMYAYGEVTISGQYIATNDLDNTIVLYPGSHLIIASTGLMKVGNQGSGTSGKSDFRMDGGMLEISGGTLEIDDQFNLLGGNLTMTGGTLFAHKHGSGTGYSSAAPGAFHVAASATGTISGGTVKVVGRANNNDSVAVKINSPTFAFSGSSVLEFTQGVNARSDNPELRVVPGVSLNHLTVNAPSRVVMIGSDATFNGKVTIYPLSTLRINPGKNVTVADSLILKNY